MRPVVVLASLALALAAHSAAAQTADSARWSLFAGRTLSTSDGAEVPSGLAHNLRIGGSVDFRSRLFPAPLRVTVAHDLLRGGAFGANRVTSVHLDGIFRPVPPVLGIRPYLLGGFGFAAVTRNGGTSFDEGIPTFIPSSRHLALSVDAGIGVELRRFFVEYRRSPFTVAGAGMPRYAPISLGVRF